ncbi:hypothetical protein OFN97_02290 [Campylobacter sp. VBCF_05 NA6]|uniref:hypothetical protein n=1 Tax=unclassified Campylobacter TaxID=2593542 RepID=UPI0022E9DA1A|nr:MULTISPECIES: hypothetical protein [unclassified Campylobacter]MDA3057777.1 hypothetical protein [Campylobacter sp. VBCF_04 NA7]MDA3058849.1 hypothetical protein [Campylobacter sp. VBCF_05 NA6]WBR54608.1 hypothetical protein PF027_01700 [Campylobacter sp. VBCF_01 NA2]
MKILKFAILGAIVGLFFTGCAHTRASGSVVYDSGSPYYRGYYESDYYYDRGYRRRPVIYDRRPVIVDRRPVVVDRRPVVIKDNRHGHINTRPHTRPVISSHPHAHRLSNKSIRHEREIRKIHANNGEREMTLRRARREAEVIKASSRYKEIKRREREARSFDNDNGERHRSAHRDIKRRTR